MNKGIKYKKSELVSAYGFLLPALILAFLFIILPIAFSFTYGVTDYYLLKPNDKAFNGIDNFVRMASDETLHKSFINGSIDYCNYSCNYHILSIPKIHSRRCN